jgi:Phytanoyl-CoA dioxygenase (PhyH)
MGNQVPVGQQDVRQEVLVLYLGTSSLRSEVISWSRYDGAGHDDPDTGEEFEPPYQTGLEALRDGWRLFAASPLQPAYPGTEYLTSHHKFEFFFERLVPAVREDQGARAAGGAGSAGSAGRSTPALVAPSPNGHDASSREPAGRNHLLSTGQMAEFVARGLLVFEGLVPEDINAVAAAELAEEGSRLRSRYPRGSDLAGCFVGFPGVTAAMASSGVQGIIHSLVGPGAVYDHHAVHSRRPGEPSQQLHADAIIDLRAAFDVQLMYYPEEVGPDAGGTLLVPGSHFRRINERDIGRYQNLVGQIALSCPAGTVAVLHHGLWHCGRRNRTNRTRYMFKLRLGARANQVRLWDTSDLLDEGVQSRVAGLLGKAEPWYEAPTARLEQLQRAALWRRLTGDPEFEVEFWLGRLENQREPRLADLVP